MVVDRKRQTHGSILGRAPLHLGTFQCCIMGMEELIWELGFVRLQIAPVLFVFHGLCDRIKREKRTDEFLLTNNQVALSRWIQFNALDYVIWSDGNVVDDNEKL